MRYEARHKTYIDERGDKVTRIWAEQIEEPGDYEKELEYIRDLGSYGPKGNKWERLLRAKIERHESLNKGEKL